MTSDPAPTVAAALPAPSADLLDELEAVYKDIHAHPELSMQEHRTAGIAAGWLEHLGCEVTRDVGGTGVVGLLRNGEGPTVLLRADMDALPMRETTGLPYASEIRGVDRFGQDGFVTHSCGHDMHVAWLLGATRILAENRSAWRGTVMVVFQPGEETGEGARAMIEDGMVRRFPRPVVALGQHLSPDPAGTIGWRAGAIMSASDSWEVTIFGRGAHGSMPEKSIDPIVMAASAVLNLQTIVSRQIGMEEEAVVTVGSLHAGTSENTIPEEALLRLNVRSFNEQVRARVLEGIRRIFRAGALGAGADREPAIAVLGEHPATRNDEAATRLVAGAFATHFGTDRVHEMPRVTASEDFGLFGAAWGIPSVFWFVGGTDPAVLDAAERDHAQVPGNHNPAFAPTLHPTIETGVRAMLAAAGLWLAPKGGAA